MVNPLVRYSNTAVVIPALVLPTSEYYPTPALAEIVLNHQPDAWSGPEDRHPTTPPHQDLTTRLRVLDVVLQLEVLRLLRPRR
jgi:hypothetical protein